MEEDVDEILVSPCDLTWVIMEEDVDEILVSPRDLQSVLLVVGKDVTQPFHFPHASQVHQHHSRVDSFRRHGSIGSTSGQSSLGSNWGYSTLDLFTNSIRGQTQTVTALVNLGQHSVRVLSGQQWVRVHSGQHWVRVQWGQYWDIFQSNRCSNNKELQCILRRHTRF